MKDVLGENEQGLEPLSVIAIGISLALACTISYNALWGQQIGGLATASRPATPLSARVSIDAASPGGTTVVLRYDPAVEEVQRTLLSLGDYQGMVDGVAGKQTKLAIQAYQKKQGLPATGEITPELLENIRFAGQIAKAADFTGSLGEPKHRAPDSAGAAQLRNVQTALAELGYQPGEITGDLTSETQAAIKRFQADRGLTQDGQVSIGLMAELSKLTGDSASSSP